MCTECFDQIATLVYCSVVDGLRDLGIQPTGFLGFEREGFPRECISEALYPDSYGSVAHERFVCFFAWSLRSVYDAVEKQYNLSDYGVDGREVKVSVTLQIGR